ncbi:hypothetical protein BaRGS_00006175, partial [Batillaria attramentaria]
LQAQPQQAINTFRQLSPLFCSGSKPWQLVERSFSVTEPAFTQPARQKKQSPVLSRSSCVFRRSVNCLNSTGIALHPAA